MANITPEMLAAMPENVREAVLADLKAETAKRVAASGVSKIKVSEKGAVSTYGLGRWPQTLYLSQLAPYAEAFGRILDFAIENGEQLTVKEGEDRDALLQRVKAVRARVSDPTPEQE